MLNVAHFRNTYLGLTETFIYSYLVNFKRVRPFVFALDIVNEERFPFPEIHSALYNPYIVGDFISKFGRRILGRDFKIESLVRELNISLLHAHFGHDGYHILPVRKKLGIPLITTFYGFDMSMLPRERSWQQKYKDLFKHGDLFLVEGNHMKKELVKIGCPEEKVKIQHIAMDIKAIPFRPRRPKDKSERTIILFCGRFSEKKGLLFALEAIAKVAKRCDSIEFRVIGDGELKNEVDVFIRNARIGKWVTLLGMQDHQKVIQELSGADIFLAPSVTAADGDSEGGAPTILIEAQAAGLPILSTFHADIPEVVLDGKSGLLVNERDVSAIADKLEYLLIHQQLWAEMGKAGRGHVETNYNISREVEKLEDTYLSIARGRQ